MPHRDWCGKSCGECENPCSLDESIPCSPGCVNLLPDGSVDPVLCAGCDAVGTTRFAVKITETLERTVVVEADSREEAEQIVSDDWSNSKHVLDADDFVRVDFEAIPKDGISL